jgi:3-hydroxybutyryl-CoA dehydrogenase
MDKTIKKIAVIGTGILGTQIAMIARYKNYDVYLYDSVDRMFYQTIERYFKDLRNSNIEPYIPFKYWDEITSSCHICNSIEEAIKAADLVIEAVPEELELKKNIFKILGKHAPVNAILATNSSSYPVSYFEESSGRPEYCLNIHFYQILTGKNMVDLMKGSCTKQEIFDAAVEWVKSLGMIPLVVKKEVMGFCFNRIWRSVKKEALYLWGNDFVDFRDIDRAWMIFTGMKQGPFGIMDRIGLDTVYNIETIYFEHSKKPDDIPPKALKDMVDKKNLGVKTGKGFYCYPDPEYIGENFLKK